MNVIIILSASIALSLFVFFVYWLWTYTPKPSYKPIVRRPYTSMPHGAHIVKRKHVVVTPNVTRDLSSRDAGRTREGASLKLYTSSTAEFHPKARFSLVKINNTNPHPRKWQR
ncbi:MAG: hypothetical protein GX452_12825 [Ignavibacteriales bacterium]|nr:hypothetical protein [Ignavibacteriales bacterium]